MLSWQNVLRCSEKYYGSKQLFLKTAFYLGYDYAIWGDNEIYKIEDVDEYIRIRETIDDIM